MRKRVRIEAAAAGGGGGTAAPRRRPRIDYGRWLGSGAPILNPAPTMPPARSTMASPFVSPLAMVETPALTSLTEALPPDIVAELVEYMLLTGREAQAIGLCAADRSTRRICENTPINPRRLGLPLAGTPSLLGAARALVTLRDPRRCILWAWLLAAQAVVDGYGTQRTALGRRVPRARAGRRDELARRVDLARVSRNDLLLWATSRSPQTMPLKAQRIVGDETARPYLWRALVAYAYGVPTGPTPYGMAPSLYGDPSDPRSGLVALDRSGQARGALPDFATALDQVEVFPGVVPMGLPPDYPYLDFESMADAVRGPEYAAVARRRIVDALTRALDGTDLVGSGCAERLFDLFDVDVFVLPSGTRLRHYAAIRLRPQTDVSPFDPIDYWSA